MEQTDNQGKARPETIMLVRHGEDVNKFEEYKFFAEDTANLAERRQTVTGTYITINSAIIGLISFLGGNQSLIKPLYLGVLLLPLIASGFLICTFWYHLISSYRVLVQFRFEQLEVMEQQMPGCHRMYTLEAERFYAKAPEGQQIHISRTERRLPRLFMVLYGFLCVLDIVFVVLVLLGVVKVG